MENSICPKHNLKIEYICFHIAKKRNDQKCSNRLLCQECNSQQNHEKSHSEFTFGLNKILQDDLSLEFFKLFFTIPEIQTLFIPLKVNTESIINKLKEFAQQYKASGNYNDDNLSNQLSNLNKGDKMIDCMQLNSLVENYQNKIQFLAERINETIDKIHNIYRSCYDWDQIVQLVNLFGSNYIDVNKTNEVLNRALQWIQCTQIFIKNIYVVGDNLNLSQLKQNEEKSNSDVIVMHKFTIKQLFLNLNHLRALFLVCQPTQIDLLENQQRLSLVTNFPLSTKRYMPTVSMSPSKNLKIQNNQLLIIKDNECLILLFNPLTQLTKLQNTIYTKKQIVDASISVCDPNQVAILFQDKSVVIYQIKPLSSILDIEQIYSTELDSYNSQICGIDYIKPQKINDNSQNKMNFQDGEDDTTDYIALKTEKAILLIDSLEWQFLSDIQINNDLIKVTLSNEDYEREEDEENQMQLEKNNMNEKALCFYNGSYIDCQHFVNEKLFENNLIKHFAYSSSLNHYAYVTENDLIIITENNEEPIRKQIRNIQQIVCIDFTVDNAYLFVLYENSQIQFFYTFCGYELENETHALKKGLLVNKAVFNAISNQLFIQTSTGELYNLDLSAPKSFF